MKAAGTHEGCIEQMYRLFAARLYTGSATPVDENGRIRLDELEMKSDIQQQVMAAWAQVDTENLEQLADIDGYRQEFLRLFGFGMQNVDYDADTNPNLQLQV